MKSLLLRIGIFFVLGIVALATYGQAVGLDLSHDEHQFLAPALLWAREGLLPYREVPIFHQPYLVALDAWVVQWGGNQPLLAARLVSGTAACLTGFLLFGVAWRASRQLPPGLRLAASAAIPLLWLSSALFLVSSGRTWNHDLPSLLAISAFALLLFAEKPGRWHWLAAGVLAGLATGSRLTVAPFAGLLPMTALLWPALPLRVRWTHLVCSGLGVFVALLPSAWFYFQSPADYLFGNFEFPRLPLLELDNSRILKTMTPWRKLRFFFKEVVVANLPLFLAAGALLVGARGGFRARIPTPETTRAEPRAPFIVLALALVAGAFAPSRYEMQHFYIVAPLAALLAAHGLRTAGRPLLLGIIGLAVVGGGLGWRVFDNVGEIFDPEDWDVTEVHRHAEELRAEVATGRVLTLAPIIALEGGLSIYPQLATGPFGWKFAYLLSAERRKELGLLAGADLGSIEPPAAILTGAENAKMERSLIQYAQKNGYRPQPFSDNLTLWRKP